MPHTEMFPAPFKWNYKRAQQFPIAIAILTLHAIAAIALLASHSYKQKTREPSRMITVSVLADSKPPSSAAITQEKPKPQAAKARDVLLTTPTQPTQIVIKPVSQATNIELPTDLAQVVVAEDAIVQPETIPAPQRIVELKPPVLSSGIEYIKEPLLEYPKQSRRLNETGKVILRVLVDQLGKPAQVVLHQSCGFDRLDRAAINAVQQALFRPFTDSGKAITAWAIVPIQFELS